jgi:hypothetical protein
VELAEMPPDGRLSRALYRMMKIPHRVRMTMLAPSDIA